MKFAAIALFSLFLVTNVLSPVAWSAPNRDLETVLSTLKVGKKLRIDSKAQGRIEGKFQGMSEGNLVLESKEGPREVRPEDIQRMWVNGRATATGILIGAAVGGLALGMLGSQTDSCDGDCSDDLPPREISSLAAEGAALGILTGGVLGGLLGTAVPDWKLRYRR